MYALVLTQSANPWPDANDKVLPLTGEFDCGATAANVQIPHLQM